MELHDKNLVLLIKNLVDLVVFGDSHFRKKAMATHEVFIFKENNGMNTWSNPNPNKN